VNETIQRNELPAPGITLSVERICDFIIPLTFVGLDKFL
jgi:hypothetical protein